MIRATSILALLASVAILPGCANSPFSLARSQPSELETAFGLPEFSQNPNAIATKLLGKNGLATEAQAEYKEAKKILPQPEKVLLAYAAWREETKDLEGARTKYRAILSNNPKSLPALLGLARIDYKSDRIGDAERKFSAVMSAFPGQPEVVRTVANFYNTEKRFNDAIRILEPAIQQMPEDRKMRHEMGTALANAGRLDEAVTHFTKSHGRASALYNVGYVLYQQKDFAQAEQYLRQAADRNPDLKQAEVMLAKLNSNEMIHQVASEALNKRALKRVQHASAQQFK